MEKSRLQDLVIGCITAVIGILGLLATGGMPETTQPYTYCVTGVFTALGVMLVVQSVINRNKAIAGGEVEAKTFKSPAVTLVLIAAYAFLMDKIGFFVTSGVFMVVMMLFLGYRRILNMAITVIGMLGFIYILFVYQLNVALPSGLLF